MSAQRLVRAGKRLRRGAGPAVAVLLACLLFAATTPDLHAQDSTTRVSVSSSGAQGDEDSHYACISADGKTVVFQSKSTSLVPNATKGYKDIFAHDRQGGQTTRVSVSSLGAQGNYNSGFASISSDGRYVAFDSAASNLDPADMNFFSDDVFVHDRQTGETTLVCLSSGGVQGNGSSRNPSISADGRYVAFESYSSDLTPGDTNGYADVFVRDRRLGLTTMVSVSTTGVQGDLHSTQPSISGDGRYVAFESYSSTLVQGDTNGREDVFVHDRQTGETRRVSVSSSGAQGNKHSSRPTISADGRYVSFNSQASTLVAGDTNGYADAFVHDRQLGRTILASVSSAGVQGNQHSFLTSISADGRFVAFESDATNFVPADTNGYRDVFLHDLLTGRTIRASVSSSGTEAAGWSVVPSLSADGLSVSFHSSASNLVPGDTNGRLDVFVRQHCPPPVPYCTGKLNSSGCVPRIGWTGAPSAGGAGPFEITQSNHAPGKPAMLFYSTVGRFNVPFHGGVLCASPPLRATPVSFSTGSGTCGGLHSFDFKARIASGIDPNLAAGRDVWAQWWGRDTPGVTSLSNALQFRICP